MLPQVDISHIQCVINYNLRMKTTRTCTESGELGEWVRRGSRYYHHQLEELNILKGIVRTIGGDIRKTNDKLAPNQLTAVPARILTTANEGQEALWRKKRRIRRRTATRTALRRLWLSLKPKRRKRFLRRRHARSTATKRTKQRTVFPHKPRRSFAPDNHTTG